MRVLGGVGGGVVGIHKNYGILKQWRRRRGIGPL